MGQFNLFFASKFSTDYYFKKLAELGFRIYIFQIIDYFSFVIKTIKQTNENPNVIREINHNKPNCAIISIEFQITFASL